MIRLDEREAETLRFLLAQPIIPPSHPSHLFLVQFAKRIESDPVLLDDADAQLVAGLIGIIEVDDKLYYLTREMTVALEAIKAKVVKGK